MGYLIISILSNVALFVLFRAYPKYKVDPLKAIITNYFAASILSLTLTNENAVLTFSWEWIIVSVFLGIIFIVGFFIISSSTERAGITPTSIASKISMVIPVFFSLAIFQYQEKPFDGWNYLGLSISIVAIYLSSVRSGESIKVRIDKSVWLPFLVFLVGGTIDTIINYVNYHFTDIIDSKLFLAFTLGSSAIIGGIYWVSKSLKPDLRSFIGGLLLGIANFSALFFVMKTLDYFDNNGALLFPVQNMAIIIASSLAALILFREKLNALNFIGLILALISIFLIAYQELVF